MKRAHAICRFFIFTILFFANIQSKVINLHVGYTSQDEEKVTVTEEQDDEQSSTSDESSKIISEFRVIGTFQVEDTLSVLAFKKAIEAKVLRETGFREFDVMFHEERLEEEKTLIDYRIQDNDMLILFFPEQPLAWPHYIRQKLKQHYKKILGVMLAVGVAYGIWRITRRKNQERRHRESKNTLFHTFGLRAPGVRQLPQELERKIVENLNFKVEVQEPSERFPANSPDYAYHIQHRMSYPGLDSYKTVRVSKHKREEVSIYSPNFDLKGKVNLPDYYFRDYLTDDLEPYRKFPQIISIGKVSHTQPLNRATINEKATIVFAVSLDGIVVWEKKGRKEWRDQDTQKATIPFGGNIKISSNTKVFIAPHVTQNEAAIFIQQVDEESTKVLFLVKERGTWRLVKGFDTSQIDQSEFISKDDVLFRDSYLFVRKKKNIIVFEHTYEGWEQKSDIIEQDANKLYFYDRSLWVKKEKSLTQWKKNARGSWVKKQEIVFENQLKRVAFHPRIRTIVILTTSQNENFSSECSVWDWMTISGKWQKVAKFNTSADYCTFHGKENVILDIELRWSSMRVWPLPTGLQPEQILFLKLVRSYKTASKKDKKRLGKEKKPKTINELCEALGIKYNLDSAYLLGVFKSFDQWMQKSILEEKLV